ncbi:hypothetical protein HAX54_028032, partial [Datura stramonium]|nr:hypothetical protein [Datura stramonium]
GYHTVKPTGEATTTRIQGLMKESSPEMVHLSSTGYQERAVVNRRCSPGIVMLSLPPIMIFSSETTVRGTIPFEHYKMRDFHME